MEIVVAEETGGVRLTVLDDGAAPAASVVPTDALAARVAELEAASRPRWVWADTSTTYARLLRGGARVERCFDLRLCRTILRRAVDAPPPSDLWDDVESRRTGPTPHPPSSSPSPCPPRRSSPSGCASARP
ncbi:hypothetical protein [Georgenia sp. Marseille-Q6866]